MLVRRRPQFSDELKVRADPQNTFAAMSATKVFPLTIGRIYLHEGLDPFGRDWSASLYNSDGEVVGEARGATETEMLHIARCYVLATAAVAALKALVETIEELGAVQAPAYCQAKLVLAEIEGN